VTVASEREGVLAQPSGATRSSLGGRVAMSFAQAARRLAGSRLSTKLAVFLLSLADPLDSGIAADSGVGGVHHDDFVVLVGGVLTHPVRVKHAEGADLATHAFLGDGLKRALELHLVDTMMSGLAVGATFGDGLLAGTTADAHAVDDESLLGAVTQAPGLLNPGRLGGTVDSGQLPVLPGSNAEEKPHDVGLLFTPQLVHVFVRPHLVLNLISLQFKQIETTQL